MTTNLKMNARRMLEITVILLACVRPGSAQDDIWNGNGDWVNSPSNWSAGVPTGTTFANINYGGTVTVSTGTAAQALGLDNFSSVDIAAGGNLTTDSFTNESGATLTIAAGGVLRAHVPDPLTGGFVFSAGSTLVLGNGINFQEGPSLFLAGGASPGDTTSIVTVNRADRATIGMVIDGTPGEANSLLKNGNGTLTLNQANHYSGGTTISQGILNVENNQALGTGPVTVDSGATLRIGGFTVGNNITISGTGVGGIGAIVGASQIPFSTISGTVALAADASVTTGGPSAGGGLLLTGTVNTEGHTLTVDGNIALEGKIGGGGNLILEGLVDLAGGPNLAFTYTGNTDIKGYVDIIEPVTLGGNVALEGFLQSSYNAFRSTSVLTVNGGSFLLFTDQTLAGLDGASGEVYVGHAGGGDPAVNLEGAGSYQYGGTLAGPLLSIVKDGSGAQEFDGVDTYGSGTTLNRGTLIAGNSSAFGVGGMKVDGGTLTVGHGNHLISVGGYTQTAGTLALSVTGTGQSAVADQLHITNVEAGPAILGGRLAINLGGFTAPPQTHATATYTFTLVAADGGYTGTFGTFDPLGLGLGLTANLDYTTDDVLLELVQEGNGFALTGLTPNQQAILAPINAGVSGPGLDAVDHGLTPLSNSPVALGAALDQLSPQAFGRFTSTTAFNNASFETQAKDSYAAARRSGPNGTFTGGNGAIDARGLAVNDPSYDPSLAPVHSRLLAWNPGPADGSISDLARPLLGGIDGKDMKSMAPPACTDPWNVFVRGNVILAQGFSGPDISHFDDNTASVVLGTDYRINSHFLVGLTAGYGHTDVTLDANGSSATIDSYSPGFYASYADRGWYANLTGDYLHNAYTQNRVIGFLQQTAISAPEGNEGVANLDGGYDFHRGALTFGPVAGLQYTHLSVDGYTEGGSVADLSVNEPDADSLRSRVGGRLSYAFSHCGMNFTPHLDATWQHEFMDSSRGITSDFQGAGLGSFTVRTDRPSRDSALVDAGAEAELNRTVTLFADYVVQAGQENYFGQSVQAGVKIGF